MCTICVIFAFFIVLFSFLFKLYKKESEFSTPDFCRKCRFCQFFHSKK